MHAPALTAAMRGPPPRQWHIAGMFRRGEWQATIVGMTCVVAVLGQDPITGGLDPAILEDGYCTAPPTANEVGMREISTSTMDCAKLMEFVFASRLKVKEHLLELHAKVNASSGSEPACDGLALGSGGTCGEKEQWRRALRTASHASSLLSAHAHIIAAVASQRAECFSEHVRLLLIVGLRRLKGLLTGQFKQLWMVGQDGPAKASEQLQKELSAWLTEGTELLDADLRTMRAVLRTWRPPAPEESRFYSHEADGRFSTMESLRRDTFEEYQLDKGLLRGLVRHILPLDASVGDFGAGSGHYASWLNDTGLVTAFAFDGSPDIELVTKGTVLGADLGRPLALWRKFDWVVSLEVAEHIPPDLSGPYLRNLDAYATAGVVLSWARPGLQGLGTANPRSEQEALDLIRQHTSLYVDGELTAKLRAASSIAYLAESLLVLTREAREGMSAGMLDDALAPGCAPEDGWIYAGNDVQMFNNVNSAAACCELCNSNSLCRFWTWSREETHKDLCWIKSTREYRINHDGFVSGARTGIAA